MGLAGIDSCTAHTGCNQNMGQSQQACYTSAGSDPGVAGSPHTACAAGLAALLGCCDHRAGKGSSGSLVKTAVPCWEHVGSTSACIQDPGRCRKEVVGNHGRDQLAARSQDACCYRPYHRHATGWKRGARAWGSAGQTASAEMSVTRHQNKIKICILGQMGRRPCCRS